MFLESNNLSMDSRVLMLREDPVIFVNSLFTNV